MPKSPVQKLNIVMRLEFPCRCR